jgi:hypothetical protein
MNTRTASFVCELATGLAIMGIVAVYNMGCAPMGSQPAREAANETRIATSSSGGGNAFATSQAVGRQQAELDQLRGIVTTLLGAQAAGRGLTAAERATLLAAARAITPAVASVATPRPAQTPATVTATPATAAPTPTFLPPSSMDAGMGLGMVGTGPGVPMPIAMWCHAALTIGSAIHLGLLHLSFSRVQALWSQNIHYRDNILEEERSGQA